MQRLTLIVIMILALAAAVTGIGWGLPSRRTDRYLFQGREPWSGRHLVELKGSDWQQRNGLGADVDIDPVTGRDRSIDLTATDRDRAAILIRYRLYSYQPDEHLTLRALASMKPSRLQFDPKLYFYGGLFIYPVGMLIGLASSIGLVDARAGLAHHLDCPSGFGAMVTVVRVYSALFGIIGVAACYLVARRFGHKATGALAGLLFLCMPIVVTLSHEGKPHLPGAVMTLLACLAGIRYVEKGLAIRWWTTAVVCGLAPAMVLSTWPGMAVMVVAICLRPCDSRTRTIGRLLGGMLAASAAFLITNPYMGINLVSGHGLVGANLGRAAGMYEMGRIAQGTRTVVRLLIEDAGPLLAVVGAVALIILLVRQTRTTLLLGIPAGLILIQFACIGAGKPDQYGRFLAFPAALLAMTAAWAAAATFAWRRWAGAVLASLLFLSTGWDGSRYLAGFVHDAGVSNSRTQAAAWLSEDLRHDPNATIGLVREPAPYCVPPLDFASRRVVLLPERRPARMLDLPDYVVATADRPDGLDAAWWRRRYQIETVFPKGLDRWLHRPTPISWANKPVLIFKRRDVSTRPSS